MKLKKKLLVVLLVTIAVFFTELTYGYVAHASDSGKVNLYRLYQKVNGEHFYTASKYERDSLVEQHGWIYEGIGWVAPKKSDTPVYRLYNPTLGDHHYTVDKDERNELSANHGWKYEGICWYSSDLKQVPLYRLFNPGLTTGSHHYTTAFNERNTLVTQHGWKNENIGWYGIGNTKTVQVASKPNQSKNKDTKFTPKFSWLKIFKSETLRLVNKERKSIGEKRMLRYYKADAQEWSIFMRDNNYYEHGYTAVKWQYQAQNICFFTDSNKKNPKKCARKAFKLWKNSSAHYRNMISESISHMDVGIAFGSYTYGGTTYQNGAYVTMNLHPRFFELGYQLPESEARYETTTQILSRLKKH
jgi:uncharacterized protein YkwD